MTTIVEADEEGRAEAYTRRSFILGVINGALFRTSEAFIHPQTVLTWFLAQLGVSNVLIGMVSPIRSGSAFLLQLGVSGHLEQQPYKLPFYRIISLFRVAGLLVLAAAVAWVPLESPWLVAIFFAILTTYSMGAGLVSVPFMDIVGKVIPAERRGSFFSQRLLWGGLLGIGASALTGYVLSEPHGLPFPVNVAALIAMAGLALGGAALVMNLIDEPRGVTAASGTPWREQVRRGMHLLQRDPNYRTFVLVRLALVPAWWAAPFFTIYAQRALDMPPERIGLYLGSRTVASLVSNFVWGPLADRHGNRRLMRISIVVGLLTPLSALLIGLAGDGASAATRTTLSYAFTVVFALMGAYESSSFVAYVGYLLDLAPEAKRPLYTATNSTLFGLASLTSFLSGIIVNQAGFASLLAVSSTAFALALTLSFWMVEPRATSEVAGTLSKIPQH